MLWYYHIAQHVQWHCCLNHVNYWGRVTYICVGELCQHWFRQWLVAWTAPSHHLNQCWNIVNSTPRNTFQWNFISHSKVFIQENAFENVIGKYRPFHFGPNMLRCPCREPQLLICWGLFAHHSTEVRPVWHVVCFCIIYKALPVHVDQYELPNPQPCGHPVSDNSLTTRVKLTPIYLWSNTSKPFQTFKYTMIPRDKMLWVVWIFQIQILKMI